MPRHSKQIKERALSLVREGKTYAAIQKICRVPKSTISVWVANAGQTRNRAKQLAHLVKARKAALVSIKHKKAQRLLEADITAKHVTAKVSLHDKNVGKCLLAMLYWAEGGKQVGNLKFTNSSPELVGLFVSLLRICYPIEESRLHVALQLHHYHDQKKTVALWSNKLSIPSSQFWKIYLKPREGKREYRRNFYGICNLHYASTPIQRELQALATKISQVVDKRSSFT